MSEYMCLKCKKPVVLNEDEELIFTEFRLFNGGDLENCPFCIKEKLVMTIEAEHMRMVGRSGLWGMCGYHSSDDSHEISVEPRKRD